MSMYAKVFEQIFDSSISEDYQTRHVFMDLLVLADPHGTVDMTVSAVARRTNVPIDIVERAIQNLMQPDPSSRTRDHEGRRLLPIDVQRGWGWVIANFVTYRSLRDENMRREQNRRAQANFKSKNKQGKPESAKVSQGKPESAKVSQGKPESAKVSQGKPESAHTEGEAELEGEENKELYVEGLTLGVNPTLKPKSFKQWTQEDLHSEAIKNNTDKLLSDENIIDFVGYWTQKTAAGKMLFTTEKTFDVRRRMNTASNMIYNKPTQTLRNQSTRVSFADQKPASYFRGKEEVKLEF